MVEFLLFFRTMPVNFSVAVVPRGWRHPAACHRVSWQGVVPFSGWR